MRPDRLVTSEEALGRLQDICSTREKCTGEVREKLRQWNIPEEESKKIIERLKAEKFIDDNRYAGFFVRDKQKFNKWGREKIRFALKSKGLPAEIIEEALSTLPTGKFEETLRELLLKKSKDLDKYPVFEKRNRLIRFAIQRGFDYDLIFRVVDDFTKD